MFVLFMDLPLIFPTCTHVLFMCDFCFMDICVHYLCMFPVTFCV